jgi:Ser/Thr protein kinase RdoA (MazF antagonist)
MGRMLEDHITADQLASHLEAHGSPKVLSVTKLDLNTSRVEFDDNVAVVARVFPSHDAVAAVSQLSSILRHLAVHDYPAERLESEVVQAVTNLDENLGAGCVLVTKFIPGTRPERNRVTFHKLGQLLGRLHTMPVPDGSPKGGAWHHLCLQGGIHEECEAAARMLDTARNDDANVAKLREELHHIQHAFAAEEANLPTALLHPDFVPPNIIVRQGSNDQEWAVIDWAGAGAGPRVLPLGFLLGVGAIWGKPDLAQAAAKGYAAHARLVGAEMRVLREAAYARFLTIGCWEVGVGRKKPGEVVEELGTMRKMGELVVASVKEIVGS